MKYIQTIVLTTMSILVISCGNMKDNNSSDGNDNTTKQFATATEAATAAKKDMLEATEKVNFGIDKEKLRTSAPGNPIISYNLDWESLMNADSNATPESIIGPENATIVPFVNGTEVVTIISLTNKGNQYSIASLGEKQITSELDMVFKVDPSSMQSEMKVYEIPNLQATIYAVVKNGASVYYTSYNNNSIRQAIDDKTLVSLLKTDAIDFQRKFGDQLKKGDLVK